MWYNFCMSQTVRDNNWLLSRLDHIWSNYFPKMEQTNPIHIRFGRFSKYRLGSIKLNRKTQRSYITITSMFKGQNIPKEVVDHTIAHELVHYAHGFSSTRARLHKYPHAGGIVNKEMRSKGMSHLIKAYKVWIIGYRKQIMNAR